MTNEDAIKELLELTDACCGQELYATKEALRMAIEALKAQDGPDTNVGSKDGDTIYRQDAILAVKTRDWLTEGAQEALTDRLEKLPSAQPQYTEITPEKAATEISCGSLAPAAYWLDVMIRLEQMGYVICRREKDT